MPSTWKRYGVDANHDGRKDPYNPVDAIFAAARYLKAARADQDVRGAIFAYNHADWYVDSVLMRARLIGGLPADLVGSLTGLTQGHFPVHAKARYADDISDTATPRSASRRAKRRAAGHLLEHAPRHQHLRQGRLAGDRGPGRQDRQDGPHRPPGQVHPAARRVRQHVHLRAPEEALARLPGAQGEDGLQGPGQEGAAPRGAQEGPQADRAGQRRHAGQGQGARRGAGRRRRRRQPRPPTLGSAAPERAQGAPVRQPEPPGRLRAPAARSSCSTRAASSRATRPSSPTSPASTASSAPTSCSRSSSPAARSSPAPSSGASGAPSRRWRRTCSSRSAPPAAAPRASTPSRSSTAGSCWSPRRSTAPPARTRSGARTPRTRRSARSC